MRAVKCMSVGEGDNLFHNNLYYMDIYIATDYDTVAAVLTYILFILIYLYLVSI